MRGPPLPIGVPGRDQPSRGPDMSPRRTKRPLPSLLAAALLFCLPASAGAAEACYLLMFGAQRVPSNPNYSHTFATFVKATWPEPRRGSAFPRLEEHTISWLP